MPIAEAQLDIWAHLGAKAQSAETYNSIRRILLDPASPYAARAFEVFLQGSYGNDTNVFADSDVDIVVCLTSTFYKDMTSLPDADQRLHESNWATADYSVEDFKRDVTSWLYESIGRNIDSRGKAIYVPASGARRDADVLACAEFRHYHSYDRAFSTDYWSGLCFWSGETRIVNYPKQHSANLTALHQASGNWLKPVVRIFKNMRNAMVRDGDLERGIAPSYFIEGALSNVPAGLLGHSYQTSVGNALAWLRAARRDDLTCANGIHWLVRDGHSVCWSPSAFETFLTAAERRWGN